jgi:hypothetical protein
MQELRHSFSNFKTHFGNHLRGVGVGDDAPQMGLGLRRAEAKLLEKVLDRPQKDGGFWEFCRSAEVQSKLKRLLEERVEALMREAGEAGKTYSPEGPLVAHHAVKCELWAALTSEEQDEWREASNLRKSGELDAMIKEDW